MSELIVDVMPQLYLDEHGSLVIANGSYRGEWNLDTFVGDILLAILEGDA